MKIDANRLRAFVKALGVTNTTLAAEAGITRQALQTLLKENHVAEVRERTVAGLVEALRLNDASLLSPDPLARYKQAVANEHADLTFAGLGLPATDPKPIDEVFVPVRVLPGIDRDPRELCRPGPTNAEPAQIGEPGELTVADCIALHRRVLIAGAPGSGKTTALRHAARSYALGRHPGQPRLPLMLRLADFATARARDPEMTLIRFVVTQTLSDVSSDSQVQAERDIEVALKSGSCLALLDGLDEVGTDTALSSVLSGFINEFGRNHFVLTSRLVGLNFEPWRKLGFSMFQVVRWHEQEIGDFTCRWYVARPLVGKKQIKNLEQRAKELATLILSDRQLRAIASNPLMLTLLAALHYANVTLPGRRVDLYAKIVEVMLETWEANKRDARPGDSLYGLVLESREFGWLLGRLALQMQREGRTLCPRWWVNDSVQQFLSEQMGLEGNFIKEQCERTVRYLCERTGLLIERGDGMFGFGHRTFQEYFAVRGLLLETEGGGDIVGMLRPHLFHPQWEEVVIHVAASLPAQRATALLRVILDDPDPAGRFLRRGQRLALRCLVEGTTLADRALLAQLFADGKAIGTSRWEWIAIGFTNLLSQLTVTRYETEAQRMLGEIEKAAKQKPSEDDGHAVGFSTPREVELPWCNHEKRIHDPDNWYADVVRLILDRKSELKDRIALISVLGEEADSNVESQHVLKKLLLHDRLPEIRAASANALQMAASANPALAKLLLERLDQDESDLVRAHCAMALRGVVSDMAEVRSRLEELLVSGPETIRASAAVGLWGLDFASPDQESLRERFLATIASNAEPAPLRCSSIWAVASLIGRKGMESVDRVIEECLADHDVEVREVAQLAIADAIVQGRKEWPAALVEKVQTGLMNVSDPCPHIYDDLVKIVEMKEIHGGRRLERLLADAVASFGDRIRSAFVFGSVARREQVETSDIDLMIIGEVRLKEVALALHAAEKTLGRTVNPVLFSAESFRDQYREGNPFLLDVVRKEKIFLKGSRDELRELVADGVPR